MHTFPLFTGFSGLEVRWVGFLGAEIDVNDKTMHHRRRNIISFIVGKEILVVVDVFENNEQNGLDCYS